MAIDRTVIDRGEGTAVVFTHGTLMDHTMFAPQIRRWRIGIGSSPTTIAGGRIVGPRRTTWATSRMIADTSLTNGGSRNASSGVCRWADSWPSSLLGCGLSDCMV